MVEIIILCFIVAGFGVAIIQVLGRIETCLWEIRSKITFDMLSRGIYWKPGWKSPEKITGVVIDYIRRPSPGSPLSDSPES